ncbi:MAG: helix-turn-helix domain-containing protein [Gammaproteobacteria bacterium]|nr:helix-turn-helix domain-containing protein [Gammaproteobacteria bacterium]
MNNMLEPSDLSQLTPGQIVKKAREDKHISLNDVSQRLLLGKQIIAAIEADDYSRIPAQVYAEGYLKAYAQLLHIPADEVIKSFRALNVYSNDEIKSNVKTQSEYDASGSNSFNLLKDRRVRLILVGMFAAVILGAFVLFIVKLSTHKAEEVADVSSASEVVIDEDKDAADNGQQSTVINDDIISKSSRNNKRDDSAVDTDQNSSDADVTNLDIPLEINSSKVVIKKRR